MGVGERCATLGAAFYSEINIRQRKETSLNVTECTPHQPLSATFSALGVAGVRTVTPLCFISHRFIDVGFIFQLDSES